MKHLIDKDALVAEINKKLAITSYANYGVQRIWAYNDVKEIIDTLEVKEVDLNKELSYEDYKSFFEKYPDLSDDWGFEEAWTFAKYFFELGLKAQKGEEV